MEVVFLFLDWLSSFAHINLKVGNQMDLSNIARGQYSVYNFGYRIPLRLSILT